MPSVGAIEEYARIIRVARRTRTQAQQDTAKGMVTKVQAIAHTQLEGWAVQEWEERVDSGEVKANEMIDQVRFWKGVTRRIEAGRCTFPLGFFFAKSRMSRAKGATNWSTYGVWGPEFRSAVGEGEMVLISAIVFGFEI